METETLTAPETQDTLPTPSEAAQEPTPEEGAATETTSPTPEESAPETPKPWAVIDGNEYADDYAAYESDLFTPHRERDARRIESRYQQDYEKRLADATRSWESTNLHNTIQGHIGSLAQKIDEVDAEGFDKGVQRLEKLAEPYMEEYRLALRRDGGAQAGAEFRNLLLDAMPDRRSRDALEDYMNGSNASWVDAIKQMADSLRSVDKQAEYERGVKDGRAAALEEGKASDRSGKGPDNARGGGGGPSLDDQKRLDRLSFGQDADGNKATDDDRAWLAAKE